VKFVPPAYTWLQCYIGRCGEIMEQPTRHGFTVEFDDGDVETFNDNELEIIKEG
jgi:hypothetical protein